MEFEDSDRIELKRFGSHGFEMSTASSWRRNSIFKGRKSNENQQQPVNSTEQVRLLTMAFDEDKLKLEDVKAMNNESFSANQT